MAAEGRNPIPLFVTFGVGVVAGLILSTVPVINDGLQSLGSGQGSSQSVSDASLSDEALAELMRSAEYKAVMVNPEFAALLADERFRGAFPTRESWP